MSNNIHQKSQMARELAFGELKKLPQYKFMPIPQSVLDAKMNEYMKLTEKELQEKINEYYSKNAFGIVGDSFEILYGKDNKQAELRKQTMAEEYRIMMSPKTAKTEQAKQVAQFNKQMRKFGIESNTPISTLSQSEEEALGFMEEMLQDATQTFETQLKNDNWITKGYNAVVKETFDSEYSKSNVQKALDETQNDITSLKTTVDFKETFKQTRGVEFNERKIKETKEKAEAMVKYQASSDMVKNLKQKLSSALTNTSGNNISRSGEKAIIETLSSMGYTSIGEVIQTAMQGHENDAAIKNYMKEGGNFAVRKDKDGNVGIYRETKEGGYQPITQEMAQIIGEEIDLRLNKLYAKTLGIPESEIEGKSSSELEELTSNKFKELKSDYEQTFAEAYGKKDIKALSENYMLSQQEGQAYIQMGVNFLAMAGAMFSGGGTLGLVSMGTIMTNPVDLIARATDEEGMTKQDWQEYGDSVLEQAGWMALGMGAGKVGDMTRSFVKLKGLQKAFKESGKSFDEFMKLAQMNKDIPQDIAKALRKTKIMSEGLGVTAEVATDLATTYALQKDGATTTDWVMSITSTLAGTATFKQLASKLRGLKSDPSATIKEIKQSFSALDLTDADAIKLHKAISEMEGVNESVPTIKQDNSLQSRLENAKSREDFAAIRDELKAMPAGEEKTALMEAYQKKYREFSTNPDRPDVRMEYKPEDTTFKELTDAEFEEMRPKVEEKLKEHNIDIKLNKYNILLADKILSDERLFNNENFIMYNAEDIIYTVNTPEQARIADKILSDERLFNNESVIRRAEGIIYSISTPEQARIADKILSDERLFNNKNFIYNAGNIISSINTLEKAKIKLDMIDKILSDERLYNNENFINKAGDIISSINTPEQVKIANKILSDERLYNNESFMNRAGDIIYSSYTPDQAKIANKILSDERLYNNENFMSKAGDIISSINIPEQAKLTDKILSYEKLYNNANIVNQAVDIIRYTSPEQANAKIDMIDKILSDERLYNNEKIMNKAGYIIASSNTPEQAKVKIDMIDKILSDERLLNNERFMNRAGIIIYFTSTPEQAKIADKILSDERLYNNENFMSKAGDIISSINNSEQAKLKSDLIDKILSDKRLYNNENFINKAGDIINSSNTPEQAKIKLDMVDKILSDKRLYNNENLMNQSGDIISSISTSEQAKIQSDLIDKILSDKRLYNNENFMNKAGDIINSSNTPEQAKIKLNMIDKILSDERLYNNENLMNQSGDIISFINTSEQAKIKLDMIDKILSDERLYNNEKFMNRTGDIIRNTVRTEEVKIKSDMIDRILSDERLYNNKNFMDNAGDIISQVDKTKFDYADKLIKQFKENELTAEQISILLKNYGEISYKDIQKLKNTIGRERVNKMNETDLLVAAQFPSLAGKQNINEIPIEEKRGLLRNLVANNTGLFEISDDLAKDFPLIPRNQEQYCTLLPAIVRSLGVDVTPLKPQTKVENFNNSMSNLSQSVAKLSDNDFANISITQEYSKDDFIKTVLSKVKDLSRKERQKVYDYYGFELHNNKGNKETGFSIIGYPVNLNNGKKLAQITDPKTKEVVENLRGDVIRFSENNSIKSNNPEVEKFLNEIIDALPELRTTIGKGQHLTHDFDIMQHSLKVMQKVTQDPKFNELNESDKKIMMLASLMHDIRKREGFSDPTHADESSFDTFFIGKKFNLSKDEEIKLYTLIKHHEWLQYVNTARDKAGNIIPEQLEKRLQSVAYDLQHDNLFDMAMMFTHADLKAVKTDNTFHDTTIGKGRIDESGNPISYGDLADNYAVRIKNYVTELKKSQPLLPVTKIPTSSVMKQAITNINSDGSTNLKGVYVDKDGLVVLKYNEVEDWESLGFPECSISKGISAKGLNNKGEETAVDTGNIKFFVHGLDYANQLAKFYAFGLVDSDALLSVSYTERPESKYRFFRPQGVILDVDTQYVYGGGNTDLGSGCEKSIADFKKNYIFGGERESDRLYISNMIKEATGMSDSEYVKFVKENENKPFTEIEPKDIRNKIIKAFATINSNVRKGNREYNEMYVSNPNVMSVFAYSSSDNVGNVMDFVQNESSRLDFLKKFALERDIPMIVFGD